MARRVFLSETHPSAVFAEQPPGPGWRAAASDSPAAQAPLHTPERYQPVPARETPGDAFHRLAELRSRAEGISLGDAYVKQSESTPDLWTDVRNAAPRGY